MSPRHFRVFVAGSFAFNKKTNDAFVFVAGNSACVGLVRTKYVETNDSIVTSPSICEYMILDKLNILDNLMACGCIFLHSMF